MVYIKGQSLKMPFLISVFGFFPYRNHVLHRPTVFKGACVYTRQNMSRLNKTFVSYVRRKLGQLFELVLLLSQRREALGEGY